MSSVVTYRASVVYPNAGTGRQILPYPVSNGDLLFLDLQRGSSRDRGPRREAEQGYHKSEAGSAPPRRALVRLSGRLPLRASNDVAGFSVGPADALVGLLAGARRDLLGRHARALGDAAG